MAVILAEVLYDTDAAVRPSLKVLERVDLGEREHAQLCSQAPARRRGHPSHCVEMLHRFMGEDEQRSFAQERLQVEQTQASATS